VKVNTRADHLPEHYEDVVKIITSYIQLLRSTPPQRWIFEEIKAISEIRFQFVERCQPSDYVSDLASRLQEPIPREKIISSQWITERFDPDAIESALRMLDIKRSVVIITAKTMPPGTESLDEVEPVFGTKFRREKMSERLLDAVRSFSLDKIREV
jgi:insulysin